MYDFFWPYWRSSYMKKYTEFPPKGLQRQPCLHARDPILKLKRSWASFLWWTPFEWDVAPEDLWRSLPASLICRSLNHLMLTWWFMHKTCVNCVNHVISEGVKGLIGDAKDWEKKPWVTAVKTSSTWTERLTEEQCYIWSSLQGSAVGGKYSSSQPVLLRACWSSSSGKSE